MSDNNKKIDSKHKFTNTRNIKDYEDVLNNNKLRMFPSVDYNNHLRSLKNPKFLGSYHMKEDIDPKYKTLNTLLRGDLEAKYSKALKSTIVNPITIALIVIGLIFNILWFFFV